MRLFVVDAIGSTPGSSWSELTAGGAEPVRLAATDLQRAQRARARIRAEHPEVAVILDLTVAVADDFRSVRELAVRDGYVRDGSTVNYVGTPDGLAGLIADIEAIGIADGVTLIAAGGPADLTDLGRDVLARLAVRSRRTA